MSNPDTRTELARTAQAMVADGKGLLAMDESHPTCQKRFDAHGIECTPETRAAYRGMLVTAKHIGKYISGAILFEETLTQQVGGKTFAAHLASNGIVPGIKVDAGAKPFPGSPDEKITEGLDGLRDRLAGYREHGARFAKWRAVININAELPTEACIIANAHALARYAALCQEAGIVPIVEPEVLMDGDHTIARCAEVTRRVQIATFAALNSQNVYFGGIVLKPNMVIPGLKCPQQASADEVAEHTLACLKDTVPAAVPGVAFLSGGMSDPAASANLGAVNRLAAKEGAPWRLTFSYGRALQQAALKTWADKRDDSAAAQSAFLHRARLNSAGASGDYTDSMEKEAAHG